MTYCDNVILKRSIVDNKMTMKIFSVKGKF